MEAEKTCDLIEYAMKDAKKKEIRNEWDCLQPFMIMGMINYKPFDEYFDARTGANIDTRSAEEILEEAEEIRRQIGAGNEPV